jgi:hypothetical protein
VSVRIVILGYVVRGPLGGLAWHHLQYVAGLARLGHDVLFVEDSDDFDSCYDPAAGAMTADPSYGLRFAAAAFERLGVGERWAYFDAHTERWRGPAGSRAPSFCRQADLLLNVSAVNPLRPWLEDIEVRALIDTDPPFTQVRNLTAAWERDRALGHTHFFSFGENIARGGSSVPDDGLPWQPTRQPILLDEWPVTPGRPDGRFTTVMQWESYPPVEHGGVRYGMKSDSFHDYLDMPAAAGASFEVALGSDWEPRELLRQHGWSVRHSLEPTLDPWTYQRCIEGSKAEFSVAKQGYVQARTGWFSERSAAYLASGRPALLQDTGFSDWLEPGIGVVAFDTPEAAAAGAQHICAHYDEHCRAARELAEAHFDSRTILTDLLERALSGPMPRSATWA